jgi:cephalosporin-C deacetylase-like acetyl esterase
MTRIALTVLALSCSLASLAEAQTEAWGSQPRLPVSSDGPRELAEYELPAERFSIQLGELEVHRSYARREVTFPSPLQERWPQVHGTYYVPVGLRAGERVPGAVVVHHLGGSFDAEAFLAQHLAQNGVAAFFISLPNYGERREEGTRQGFLDPEDPVGSFTGFRQAALDVIRASDFLRAMPEVDPEQVGAVGVSLGAVVTALARGLDTRLGRTVLVIGGGDLPRLISESPEIQRFAEGIDLDPEQLQSVLTPVDPLTFASRVRTEDVLMLAARRDEVIPRACTDQLWEALGRPTIRWFNCGHYGVVLHMPTLMNAVLDHLREQD